MSTPDAREVCSLIAELNWQIEEHIRNRLTEHEMTPSQAIALRELTEPLTMRQLAQRMHCEASNVTYLVDRLEQAGLVIRTAHPSDRRAKVLQLTAAGIGKRREVLDLLAVDSPLSEIPAEDVSELSRLLRSALEQRVGSN